MNTLKTYKPIPMKIKSWQQIEDYYIDLISNGWRLESMLSLIKFIRESDFEERLFGHIYFLEYLVITIYNPGEWHREALHIKFNRTNKRWNFEYFPKPFEPSEHDRYYDEAEGIEKFCQFMKWLKW